MKRAFVLPVWVLDELGLLSQFLALRDSQPLSMQNVAYSPKSLHPNFDQRIALVYTLKNQWLK